MRNKIGILLALSVLAASAGFMTVVQSRCTMTDEASGTMACESMACCTPTAPVQQHESYYATTVRCNSTTLAGLPSTLVSTPAHEYGNAHVDLSIHFFTVPEIPSAIGNLSISLGASRQSETLLVDIQDKCALFSTFLI